MNDQRFSKSLRLTHKRDIDRLFAEGKSLRNGDLTLKYYLWHNSGGTPELKVLAVAPKRYVKNATDRNRIKRLIREAFRHNKKPLEDFMAASNKSVHLAVVYAKSGSDHFDVFQLLYNTALKKMLHTIGKHP